MEKQKFSHRTKGDSGKPGEPEKVLDTRSDYSGLMQITEDICLTYLAGEIDASPAGPWIGSAASAIERLECAAYNYCTNAVQTFIEGKDLDRIYAGGKTFLKGAAEAFGGAALVVVGGFEIATGAGIIPGAGKISLGSFGLTTAVADVSQGVQDIEYGWRRDSTTPNSNFIRDSLFGGNGKQYEIVSTLVGALGVSVGFVNYPMLGATSATALIPGRGTQGNLGTGQVGRAGSIADAKKLDSMTPAELSKMTPDQLKQALPNGWTYNSSPDGKFVHIRDSNGIFRIRIDPADAVTAYPHIHIFDANGNLLDINGNIVPANSPDGHIPR